MAKDIYKIYEEELERLCECGNLRSLPHAEHSGKYISVNGNTMLNLSSNDYLGLNSDESLVRQFMSEVDYSAMFMSSSSSRLLTGNFKIYDELEKLLAAMFSRESALVFNSGYHMNMGILPAISDSSTLILADKLVHASLIDGIRLCSAKCIRYRHQDYMQLEKLLEKHTSEFSRIIVVTESIFSMDGDIANLSLLVELKKRFGNVMLYVDEAHGIGVRGAKGLGLAEEQECLQDIDFLCGTFGKALCSVGAYVVCDNVVREYLVNKMRTIIFTTALPPVNVAWTKFIVERLVDFSDRRAHLDEISARLRSAFEENGCGSVSSSHIIPMIVGASADAIIKAEEMQKKGVYVLPVRPPTVPEGTSRLRFSLTASITDDDLRKIINCL